MKIKLDTARTRTGCLDFLNENIYDLFVLNKGRSFILHISKKALPIGTVYNYNFSSYTKCYKFANIEFFNELIP